MKNQSVHQRCNCECTRHTISGVLTRRFDHLNVLEVQVGEVIVRLYCLTLCSEFGSLLLKGAKITAENVYPVYLWGKACGFGACVHSRFSVHLEQKQRDATWDLSKRMTCHALTAWSLEQYRVLQYVAGSRFKFHELAAFSRKLLSWVCGLEQKLVISPGTESRVQCFGPLCSSRLCRANCDSDWLSSQLPKVWFAAEIQKLSKIRQQRTKLGLNGIYYDDSFARIVSDVRGCFDFAQFERNDVVVGEVERLSFEKSSSEDEFAFGSMLDALKCSINVCFEINKDMASDVGKWNDQKRRRVLLILKNPILLLPFNFANIIGKPMLVVRSSRDVKFQLLEMVDKAIHEQDKNGRFHENPSFEVEKQHRDNVFESICGDAAGLYSVTDCLLKLEQPGQSACIGAVVGIVLYIQQHDCGQDNEMGSISKYRRKIPRSVVERDCRVCLQDTRNANYIMCYMPSVLLENLIVGFVAEFVKCTLSCRQVSKKQVFLRCQAGQTAIRLVNIAPLKSLSTLYDSSFCAPLTVKQHLTISKSLDLVPVPMCLRQLIQCRERCSSLFSIVGDITFIRKIGIYLRCSICHSPAFRTPSSQHFCDGRDWHCQRCRTERFLVLVWEAALVLDDGSGECQVYLEGDVVILFIKQLVSIVARKSGLSANRSPTATAAATTDEVLLQVFSDAAMSDGQVEYTAYAKNETSGSCHEEFLVNGANAVNDPHDVGEKAAKAKDLLLDFLATIRILKCVKLSGRVLHRKPAYSTGNHRAVRCQEINDITPWTLTWKSVWASADPRLSVEGFEIELLHQSSVTEVAWSIVNSIH